MKTTKPTKTEAAMSALGSLGGKAIVKQRGKEYMSELVSKYWRSKPGRARRAAAKARRSKLKTK